MEATPKALQPWSKCIKFYHSVLIIPYDWDSYFHCPQVNLTRWKKPFCIYSIQFALVLAYELFLLYRVVQELEKEEEPFRNKIKMLFSMTAYVMLNVNQLVILRNFLMYPTLLANLSKHLRRFNASARGRNQGEDQSLRNFHVAIVITSAIPALARAMDVFRQPQFPALLTSLFENPQELSLPVRLVLGYAHLHLNAFHYMNFAFNLTTLTYYYYGFTSMARSLKVRSEQLPRSRRTMGKIAHFHRQLYVMQDVCNGIFGTYVLVIQIMGILFSTFNLFMAVAFTSIKHLSIGLSSLFVFLLIFGTMANVFEETEVARRSWDVIRLKWFAKFRLSARPIAVSVGAFYIVDRQLLLTLLDIVTDSTANLILTYRS